METSHLLGLISIISGMIMLTVPLIIILRRRQFRENIRVAETTATIIENIRPVYSEKMYNPVLEYTTKEGETIIHRSKMGSNPPRFKEGEQVKIYYHMDKPEKHQVKAGWPYYLLISIFLFFGIITSVIGVVPFVL
ncbi:DUF3592 domain-containing protein [Aciduricibacillus chroicocephali]|uniref:DUF3592 domain-containing protein n=1 Tax=Aciduricibacillus chroicocephali TaxID=3054939 RepID=A0ABY9KXF6_9BACI|nr:DUF3592 domain-containing protein [Bacillaceae bacterium 44XB]